MPPKSNTALYVTALIILILAGFAFIVTVTLARPDKDNTTLLVMGLGIMIPATTGILNMITGAQAKAKADEAAVIARDSHLEVKETRKEINGRVEDLVAEAKKAAHLIGYELGKRETALLYTQPPATENISITQVTAPVVPIAPAAPLIQQSKVDPS